MGWIGPITLETFAGDLLTALSIAVLLGLAFAAVRDCPAQLSCRVIKNRGLGQAKPKKSSVELGLGNQKGWSAGWWTDSGLRP